MDPQKPENNAQIDERSTDSTLVIPPSTKPEHDAKHVDLERMGETHGYVLDEEQLRNQLGLTSSTVLKKSKEGLVLIPQPTDDKDDPLNWTTLKKTAILTMIAWCASTADYSAATGASALLPQAKEWHISPDTVNHATAGNTFMLGAGGLATVWLSAYIGRLPVLFYFSILSLLTAIWSAAATTFESYMTSRILNGFFAVAAAGGGLMWINDIYFFHQRPRKINIWSTALILSPFLGPMIMAAIINVASWRVGMWLNVGLIATGLILVITVGDETFYPRHMADLTAIPPRKSRIMRLIGIEQIRSRYTTNGFLEAGSRQWFTIAKLPVFLTCFFYFLDFPWTIANNTTISVFIIPEYNFTYGDLATIYVAPVVGAIFGLAAGHFGFDFLGKLYAKRHGGRLEPEARLLICWLVTPFKLAGYNMIGSTLQHHWSYWILAVGWFMHNFATIVTTAAVGAYLIDAYPEASGESAAWLNGSRLLGGFIIGYVQINWVAKMGPQNTYGIQSAIMGAGFLVIIFLQFYGKKLRARSGRLNFKTN